MAEFRSVFSLSATSTESNQQFTKTYDSKSNLVELLQTVQHARFTPHGERVDIGID